VLRGREVSRIEGFSDAVFGFALTLLVVSLEVPNSFNALERVLIGFPAFAVTFTIICWIWYEHYLFFRRYDLEDGFTVVLNCVLLFLVVFYTYPLKFIATRMVSGTLLGLDVGITQDMTADNARLLMTVYSAGFVALFATFMLLHWNAWRQRVTLNLDPFGIYDTRASIRRHSVSVAVGLASVMIAMVLPMRYLGVAGLIYFLLGPAHAAFGYWNGRNRKKLEASLCALSGTPPPVTRSADASNV
jgi:uncharacterized membrane protein